MKDDHEQKPFEMVEKAPPDTPGSLYCQECRIGEAVRQYPPDCPFSPGERVVLICRDGQAGRLPLPALGAVGTVLEPTDDMVPYATRGDSGAPDHVRYSPVPVCYVWVQWDGQNSDRLMFHTQLENYHRHHPFIRFFVDVLEDGRWSAYCGDQGIFSQGEKYTDIAPQLEDAVRTHFGDKLLAFEPHRIHVVFSFTRRLSSMLEEVKLSEEARDYQTEIDQLHQTIDALKEELANKPAETTADRKDLHEGYKPSELLWECLLHNREKGEQLASLLTFIRDNHGPRTDADELCKAFPEDFVEVVWFECLAIPDSSNQPLRITGRGLQVLENLTQRLQKYPVPGGPSLCDSVATVVYKELEEHVTEQDERSRVAARIAKRLTVPQPTRELDEWAQWDGTDGAHPSWWRGQDDGVRGATERVKHALEVDLGLRQSGTLGYKPLQEVVERILALRRAHLNKNAVIKEQKAEIKRLRRKLCAAEKKIPYSAGRPSDIDSDDLI